MKNVAYSGNFSKPEETFNKNHVFPVLKIVSREYFAFNTIVSVIAQPPRLPEKSVIRHLDPPLIDTTLHLSFPEK